MVGFTGLQKVCKVNSYSTSMSDFLLICNGFFNTLLNRSTGYENAHVVHINRTLTN